MENQPRVALITGANKGIGFEIARQLAKRGHLMLLGARDEDRGRQAAARLSAEGLDVRLLSIDVTRAETVAAAARLIAEQVGRLDVLVNNAGIAGGRAAPSATDLALVRGVFETNVFGVIAVTQAMLPLLRASPAPRIVNVSSEMGSLTELSDPRSATAAYNNVAYPPSKSALNAVTIAFANELRATPIKVNSACPGFTATDLNQNRGHRTVEQGA